MQLSKSGIRVKSFTQIGQISSLINNFEMEKNTKAIKKLLTNSVKYAQYLFTCLIT